MSLVFGSGKQTAPVTFSEISGPDVVVFLDQNLWNAVNEQGDGQDSTTETSEAPTKVAVVVEPLNGPSSSKGSGLSKIMEWAVLDASITGASFPRKWVTEYPNLFSDPSLISTSQSRVYQIGRVHPPVLSEVVLLAKTSSALQVARAEPERVKNSFCSSERFLRHGSSYPLDSSIVSNGDGPSDGVYDYEVIMTQPVLQGVVDAALTSFIVTADASLDDTSDNGEDTLPNGVDSRVEDDRSDVSELDGIEIGEGFLASSVPPLSASTLSSAMGNNPAWDDEPPKSAALSETSSRDASSASEAGEDSKTSGITLSPRSLSSNPALPAQGHFAKGEDPEIFTYVSPADLGSLGLFSGDWAAIAIGSAPSRRLVRVAALTFDTTKCERGHLLASPILIHNVSPDLQSVPFSIRRAPFGARPPPLPTAKSITVARVASPYSNNKMFQPLFLRGLKEYFDDKIRLHRMGDLIAITIHAEDARLLESVTEGEEGDEASTQELRDALLDQDFPLASSVATGVVFFKITNISHDIASIQVNDSPAGASDDYFAATMGELGCWVDSKVTQIIQTGLEYSRVPDVTDYLRIGEGLPPTPSGGGVAPFDKLLDLISAAFLPGAIHYGLRLSALLKGARGISKRTVVHWVARKVGIHVLEINCFDIVGDSDIKTEGTLRARFEKATESTPCIILLRHIEALARNSQTLETGKEPPMATILQECLAGLKQTWMISSYPVFAIATTSEPEKIPPGVLNSFKHEITFEAPAEAERHAILKNLLMEQVLAPDVSTKSLATQTAALVAADLVDLVHRAKAASVQRTISSSTDGAHSIEAGLVLTGADFDSALGAARSSYSESIGAPSIPNVTWDDVGGLAAVKKDILDTIQLPLDYPELFADGLKKRSGILLYGPPGTGKTLLAKAVATSCSLNFFSVKGPELLNMYIGESEANVRRVFQRARDAKPCVIFFDELDSVAPKRGNHGDSGGVMDRIVSQLLAELDGMSDGSGGSGADVFVIGATNRPDLLDSALLRPGRFDRMLYLGVSDTHEAQLNILGALTRKFRLAPDLNLKDIADQCPFNYTGADFYALCSDAMLKSMSRKAQEVDDRIAELNARPPPYSHPHPLTPQYYLAEMATPEEIDVLVSRVDFELALSELVPSVSQQEMDHYREVQKKFASDTINAKKEEDAVKAAAVVTNGVNGFHITDEGSDEDEVTLAPQISRVDKGKGRAVD